MAFLRASRGVQFPLVAQFDWTYADTAANTSGVTQGLKATGAGPFDVINLPTGAIVIGGELTVNTASNDSGATASVAVGDSANATRYLSATSVKTAGRTALTLTGFKGAGENLRITVVNTNGDATAGSYSLRLLYVIDKRAHEVVTN